MDSQGTVNAIFRIGGQFAARFALRPGDAGPVRRLLESEARAALELAGRTRFRTPEPVALDEPGLPRAWAKDSGPAEAHGCTCPHVREDFGA